MTGSFRGRLKALSIADILEFLRGLNRPGLLALASGGCSVGLHLRDRAVVHASSTRECDRLVEVLRRAGRLGPERIEAVMARVAAGVRPGQALVEAGGLLPRELVEARRLQARQIALSVFEWESGEFAFEEDEEAPGEGVGIGLPIADLIVEGIRSVGDAGLFLRRLPAADWTFEAGPPGERPADVRLEPHEEVVLALLDGTRDLKAVAAAAEFSDLETRRIVFLLSRTGHARLRARAPEADPGAAEADRDAIIRHHNARFGEIHRYLARAIGPIGEHLLARALGDLGQAHPVLFSRAALGADGTLDPLELGENLRGVAPARRREVLVDGLGELLCAELLVLRRTLGPDHERRVVRALARHGAAGAEAAPPAAVPAAGAPAAMAGR